MVSLSVFVIFYKCLFVLECLGGPYQMPHLAPTYAAVLALCSLGTEEAYQAIDR